MTACRNCGVMLHGRFCHACGQNRLTLGAILAALLVAMIKNAINSA